MGFEVDLVGLRWERLSLAVVEKLFVLSHVA